VESALGVVGFDHDEASRGQLATIQQHGSSFIGLTTERPSSGAP